MTLRSQYRERWKPEGMLRMLADRGSYEAILAGQGVEAVAALWEREPAAMRQALARHDSGREYLNFAEHRTDVRRLWPIDVYRRLREVKTEHDPLDVFRSNHPVPPNSR